jgi:hypothetical protein
MRIYVYMVFRRDAVETRIEDSRYYLAALLYDIFCQESEPDYIQCCVIYILIERTRSMQQGDLFPKYVHAIIQDSLLMDVVMNVQLLP